MVRLTEPERGTITLYDAYVITLFDKGLSTLEKLNKKQWKDLHNAGYMIDRLYTLRPLHETSKNPLKMR